MPRFATATLTIGLLAMFIVGCDSRPVVRVYTVPKGKELAAQPKQPAGQPVPRRILSAIIPSGTRVYYVKATEEPSKLDPFVESLKQVTADLEFDGSGQPQWKVPEGWRVLPGTGIALAVLEATQGESKVNFAVTELGFQEGDWDRYLEDNVNRWCGQLSLPSKPLAELKQSMTEVSRPGEPRTSWIVDLVGTQAAGGPMSGRMPPMMSGAQAGPSEQGGSVIPKNGTASGEGATSVASNDSLPAVTIPKAAPKSDEQASPLKYQTPAGWTYVGTGPFRLATFEVKDGEKTAEVTVSSARNDELQNVRMWQGQIYPTATDEEIQKGADSVIAAAEKFTKGASEGKLYMIRGADGDDPQSLCIAALPMGGEGATLFVKMRGGLQLITAQRQQFLEFLNSIEL